MNSDRVPRWFLLSHNDDEGARRVVAGLVYDQASAAEIGDAGALAWILSSRFDLACSALGISAERLRRSILERWIEAELEAFVGSWFGEVGLEAAYQGSSIRELAKPAGVHPTTILRRLRKSGAPVRPRGRPRRLAQEAA